MKRAIAFTAAMASLLAPFAAASPLVTRAAADSNPYAGYEMYVSPYYKAEIDLAIADLNARGETALAAKAAAVAQVPTFIWIASRSAVPSISTYLKDAYEIQKRTGKKQVVSFVVYNLPDRDCSAKASDGELKLSDSGESRYEAFIKDVAANIARYPQVQVVIQLETDAIGNLVTNLAVPKCGNAAPAHKRLLALGVALLQAPNVAIYLDGAHAGWLGWPDNLGPTADILAEILTNAKAINPNAKVRGVATNVSNYNGLGNQPQMGRDELVYHKNLAPLLEAKAFPAHFIVDQGRSGNQDAPRDGGDWCNFSLAGFGPRPTTATPDPLVDAIVWVKPGGESDGTSDTTAVRYDQACGSATSAKPAPEAGNWFQAYFEQLINQANPPF
ncbi:hypothetical protein FRC03_002852 [Tulasnella sp. 419]|nr:hypothetical protein FRC02_001441 [Tulasnella sp. 418]KAG8963552.1 hypothetical protein FRC03_002852 [Tulasnella sp. 419]